jgi:hypothetical protein
MKQTQDNSKEELELINDISRFVYNPLGYVLYAYPWGESELSNHTGPDEWQTKVLLDIGEKLTSGSINNFAEVIREATASGHGVGKSALVSWLINWAMDTLEFTRGVVTANTDTQLRTKTWPEVQKWSRLRLTAHWTTVTATAIYSNEAGKESNWRIDAIPWSKENPEAFAGLHNQGNRILLIFDEASAVDDRIWEVAEGAMTDSDTQIIWCVFGNPTRNTGRFRECWKRFRSLWKTWEVDSRTAKMSNKTLIQEWLNTYGEDSDFFKIRVRGMFPSQSAKQYISSDDVDASFGKHLRSEQYNFAAKILSVEPAWEGDDNLEIGIRQGLAYRLLRTIPRNDNDFVIGNIVANYEDSEQADAVVVDGGFGTGIISAGRTMGRNWLIIWYSGESPDPDCINARAYMWKKMKEWLKAGGAIPADQNLYDDLIGPEIVARPDGKLQLESKKDMKARGIPSPNKADNLAQTFMYDIQPKQSRINVKGSFARSEYDVLGPTPGSGEFANNEYDIFK